MEMGDLDTGWTRPSRAAVGFYTFSSVTTLTSTQLIQNISVDPVLLASDIIMNFRRTVTG